MPASQHRFVRVSKTDEAVGSPVRGPFQLAGSPIPDPPPKADLSQRVAPRALPVEDIAGFDGAKQGENCRTLFILAGLGAVLVGLLWWWDPGRWQMPVCSFHRLTGWHCPGCGGLRAAHALLHGRLAEAWADNRLLVLLLPWVGYGLVLWSLSTVWPHRRWRGRWLYSPCAFLLISLVAMLFGILRNLPWEPFCHWAPGG